MKYELAKQLKDAGFPSGKGDEYISTGPYEQWMYPAFEELLAACGSDFRSLTFYPKSFSKPWVATQWPKDSEITAGYPAATPTEAVALLWLSLNKN